MEAIAEAISQSRRVALMTYKQLEHFMISSPDSNIVESLTATDLRDSKRRAQLSPGAFRRFLTVANGWSLPIDQRLIILGELSRPTYYNWVSGNVGALSRDRLERVAIILAIHEGLGVLCPGEGAALEWLNTANTEPPFYGSSPLRRALNGSIDDLYAIQRYIDARGRRPCAVKPRSAGDDPNQKKK